MILNPVQYRTDKHDTELACWKELEGALKKYENHLMVLRVPPEVSSERCFDEMKNYYVGFVRFMCSDGPVLSNGTPPLPYLGAS
jgi:hypothetical protein